MTLIRTAVSVTRLSGVLGAVVHDIPLGGDLSAGDVDKIRTALLEHRVVFFRDQTHLDDEGQRSFAKLLGPITAANPLSTSIGGGADHTVAIDSHHIQANAWHTDATFVDRPPAFSVLRAIKLPSVGGDTLWANTVWTCNGFAPVT
ncbi:MAG: TauD/TfdA dioxygenase family protein [Sphingobium sp.]